MIARTYAAEGGTAGVPAFTYVDEPGLGLYRASAGKQAHQGNLRIQGAAEITGALTVLGTITASGGIGGITNPVAGVAASYKLARGAVVPTTAAHTVVTGLTTVVAAVVSFKGPQTLTHMFVAATIGDQAGAPAAGSIVITSLKPTGVADVSPIDASTPWSAIDWIAVGG
jgi:hypothetical protein